MKPDIVRRYAHNPILIKAEIPYPVETVHNAAVVKHGDEYVILFRSHLRTGRSIIGFTRSPDGVHFTADPEPFLTPARDPPGNISFRPYAGRPLYAFKWYSDAHGSMMYLKFCLTGTTGSELLVLYSFHKDRP
jgi:hypothetical protein